MKFVVFILLFCGAVFAGQSAVIDVSSTNLPASYTGANAQILSNIRANTICCANYTNEDLLFCLRASAASACGDDWLLKDNSSFCFDHHPLANSVFVKGLSGAVTTGYLTCRVWMQD